MDDITRCQSCGLPLSDAFGNYGTNKGGSDNTEYCIFCFKNGSFTNPHLTMKDMIAIFTKNMMRDIRIPGDKASELAHEVIPNLKRWKKA